MCRAVRRQERALSEEEARDILARAEYGVMATVGEDGWPYAVPLNHVLAGNVLYVHGAAEGHKLDNVAHEPRVSYCAVAHAQVVPAMLSTLYESAVVFGRATLVTDATEKHDAIRRLASRFGESSEARIEDALRRAGSRAAVIRIQIERITGKAHRPASNDAI